MVSSFFLCRRYSNGAEFALGYLGPCRALCVAIAIQSGTKLSRSACSGSRVRAGNAGVRGGAPCVSSFLGSTPAIFRLGEVPLCPNTGLSGSVFYATIILWLKKELEYCEEEKGRITCLL